MLNKFEEIGTTGFVKVVIDSHVEYREIEDNIYSVLRDVFNSKPVIPREYVLHYVIYNAYCTTNMPYVGVGEIKSEMIDPSTISYVKLMEYVSFIRDDEDFEQTCLDESEDKKNHLRKFVGFLTTDYDLDYYKKKYMINYFN